MLFADQYGCYLVIRMRGNMQLKLIGRYLRAGIDDNGILSPSLEGVPQGGPLSPLLSNIMLDDLDKELEQRGHQFARYADDFIILVKSKRAGERVLASVTRFLENKLKLLVNTDKSQVVKTAQSKFLGFTFKRGLIKWHDKTLHKFKRQVRILTNRNWGVSMQYQLFKLSQYLRGWINYFGIANVYQHCVDLHHWIRRRVRMWLLQILGATMAKTQNQSQKLDETGCACASSRCLWDHKYQK